MGGVISFRVHGSPKDVWGSIRFCGVRISYRSLCSVLEGRLNTVLYRGLGVMV